MEAIKTSSQSDILVVTKNKFYLTLERVTLLANYTTSFCLYKNLTGYYNQKKSGLYHFGVYWNDSETSDLKKHIISR